MASSLRRLASDHANLHNSGLPPHYLFPPTNALSSIPDDLTQLTILLTGPQGTPYSQGLWRLHLKIPSDYPQNPPKASFRTRIWHPNVDETSGAVCVDTLKKDWEPKLTLRDVLITISCLLIHPNPDSALNSSAGALLQEDYEEFARQARLMTSIHAPIPSDVKDEVTSAKRRGDDGSVLIHDEYETDHHPVKARKSAGVASVVMKKPAKAQDENSIVAGSSSISLAGNGAGEPIIFEQDMSEDEENDDLANEFKENDPSLSPSPVTFTPPSPRKNVLGKRPLSVISTSLGLDTVMVDIDDDEDSSDMTSSEKNIAANHPPNEQQSITSSFSSLERRSPKLSGREGGVMDSSSTGGLLIQNSNSIDNIHDENPTTTTNIFSGIKPPRSLSISRDDSNDGKENFRSITSTSSSTSSSRASRGGNSKSGILKQKQTSASSISTSSSRPLSTSSKITKPSIVPRKLLGNAKQKPRVGVRRL